MIRNVETQNFASVHNMNHFICNLLTFQWLMLLITNSLFKILHKIKKNALFSKKCSTFAIPKGIPNARVAESVDALVSNTSSFTGVPVRPRPRVQKEIATAVSFFVTLSNFFLSKNADVYLLIWRIYITLQKKVI